MPRPADEVQQLARALVLLLTELDKLPEVKSPPKPAAAAAAGGQGTDLTAAAGPSREEELAARAARHGSLPAHTVTALRDGLAKAGLPDKLPPACRKVRREGAACGGQLLHSCTVPVAVQHSTADLSCQANATIQPNGMVSPVQGSLVLSLVETQLAAISWEHVTSPHHTSQAA